MYRAALWRSGNANVFLLLLPGFLALYRETFTEVEDGMRVQIFIKDKVNRGNSDWQTGTCFCKPSNHISLPQVRLSRLFSSTTTTEKRQLQDALPPSVELQKSH